MKLIMQNSKIAGTATDNYQGEESTIDMPDDFDIENLEQYKIVENDGIKEVKIKIPVQVTIRQARLALLQAGLLDDIETTINAIEDETLKKAVQIEWEYAQDIRRDWQALIMITQAMGMTDEQLDELFLTASKL